MQLRRMLLLGCFLALSACGGDRESSATGHIVYRGECPPKGVDLPEGWRVHSAGPSNMEGLVWSGQHFDIPLSKFGVKAKASKLAHASDIFVSIRDCTRPTSGTLFFNTPCHELDVMRAATEAGAGFASLDASKTVRIKGLEFGYRRFWPKDRSWLGKCYGLDSKTYAVQAERSFCLVWVPHPSGERGLYIIVPGEAVKAIPQIVATTSRVLLDARYADCAIFIRQDS